ncbi:DNA/RNA non-specific endonuclease [Actinophytocola sp.]|uniref:DNA/RNA non-specific endonuclease n=1 Tax=Actinophytocola sp. TaxID=1872138 RepID=UPI002EDA3DB5
MRPTIVYVHGNGNMPRADRLRMEWDRALFGRDLATSSRMAYWASVRYSRPLDELPETTPAPTDRPHLVEAPESFIVDTLLGAAKEAGPAELAADRDQPLEPWLRRMTYAAEAMADDGSVQEVLPLPRAARIAVFRELVRRNFQDVYAYFFGGAKEPMRDAVRRALDGIDGPVVVLAYSLGSIIAYDVLRERADGRLTVPLFVTVGSPLGVTEIQDLVTTPLEVPAPVAKWVNVSDLRDLVALDHTIRSEFRPADRCQDFFVDNPGEGHHGIVEYLRTRPVRDSVLALFGSGPETAVAARAADRAGDRQKKIGLLKRGALVRADEPRRVADRIDRLSRHDPAVRPVSAEALAANEPAAVAAAEDVLERIILTDDLLGVGYLEGGVAAARAVGRVVIRDEDGRVAGYGTGSLVSPELLLTNHHVLPDAAVAGRSRIEFDFQDGPDGRPLQTSELALDPDRFFQNDQTLDFALVAVRATPGELARFGFNRLVEAEGKAIVGDFVTIVQHPGGEKKQIALRENRVVDVLDRFLHYETDTEPGSSGSPVFNDQWEVVALHHAAVPAPEHGELGGWLNEGLRVSRLLAHLRGQEYPAAQRALVDALLGQEARAESVRVDPDYSDRAGYDPDFLTGHHLPLPALPADLLALAAVNRQATGDPAYVLPYHHFSVVLNKERRLAFFTAVNIDGAIAERLPREPDRWMLDPRLPDDEQTGEAVYRTNPLDRGHLVRRLDPAWGTTKAIAKSANDDTFHFTNCAPQHANFNQNDTTWAGLEDYILNNADTRDLRVTVVTGPILAADDDTYRGVRLPRQFWKVVAMVRESGELSATGYLLSQAGLIDGLEAAPAEAAPAKFSYGAYRTFQVPIRKIEGLTRLSFGDLAGADPLGAGTEEAAAAPREINQLREIVL